MKRRRSILYLLLLSLILVAVLGMVACSNRETPQEEEQEQPVPDNYDVNYYLAKVNEGLVATNDLMNNATEPLTEYTVESEYTFRTGVENYTMKYSVTYGESPEKNKYYLYLFDNVNHINRATFYYDSKDLYVYSDRDKGRYKIDNFNTYLLYGVFSEFMLKVDFYNLFFDVEKRDADGSIIQDDKFYLSKYFRRGSLLTNVFGIKDVTYNRVGDQGEAIYFKNGDVSILISTLNDRIAGVTEGIGTSFDSVTYNMLGFKLSKLIEYKFNSIIIDHFGFLMEKGGVTGKYATVTRTNEVNATINGRMLDGSDYSLDVRYNYSATPKAFSYGEDMKTKYDYDRLTPGAGSFEGEILFPTIRPDQAHLASLDYDLNAEDNTLNRFTFRIYDQRSTESEVTNKYANIDEFLSFYYVDEYLYINATGLCDVIGTPVALESLHLPKVYLTDIDMCDVLKVAYSYAIRIMNVLLDYDGRTESKANKELYEALMDAVSSPDLMTLLVEVTEELIKDIRGDDTSLAFLLSRVLTGRDDALSRFLPNDFFQLLTIFLSYIFVDDDVDLINIRGVYNKVEYFNGTFHRVEDNELVFPKDLNDLYYTLFVTPEVVTLDYDVTLQPYHVEKVDVSQFFGIFVGDGTGKNTPCFIENNESLSVRGKVSESYNTNSEGERVAVTTVNLMFYKTTAERETPVMSLVTNPAKKDELLVTYYYPIGINGVTNLKYRIPAESVKQEMEKLTGEDNIFLSESNFVILFGLMSSLGGNSETYVRDNRYYISVMTDEKKDPIKELIGVSDTYTLFRIKVSFSAVDLSSVSAGDYSVPFIETLSDLSVRSIYSDDSAWKESVMTYVNSMEVPMYLTYTEESTEIKTGQSEYTPTAYLYGKEIQYKLSILDVVGTYLITDILTGRETVSYDYAYAMEKTGLDMEKPQYLLVIDPVYTKKLPAFVDVRYETFEIGTVNCYVENFIETNITREGYNLAYLAGDYDTPGESYILRIGKNSIATYVFSLYISVLNRNVIAIKENSEAISDDAVAFVNNVKQAESVMRTEVASGTSQASVISGKSYPVVGVITVDPYTYAMKEAVVDDYDMIRSEISGAQMAICFYGFYGVCTEKDEKTAVESQYNKYYNKEGYNYVYLADRVSDWQFDYSQITWQGGVFYATATFGSEDGYAIPIAIRIAVKRKEVKEVRIDNESNSIYTIDYLIRSTYTIPTTGANGHAVRVVFKDDSVRSLVLSKPGSVSESEYYEQYIRGSLNWAGTEHLSERISVQGTSSLFGTGQNATSQTWANFGESLGVGMQKVILNVLQPSRYQSSDDETNAYIVREYVLGETPDGKITTDPQYKNCRISNAKFYLQDAKYASYDINPYDFSAALPQTVWLYVNKDNVTKEWKEYAVNWMTTDADGHELNLIKEKNGRYVLAYPSTEERKLLVYGRIGDETNFIRVTMIVRNLFSELQSVKFYSYSYEKQTVEFGAEIPENESYYEYIVDSYAQTMDKEAKEGKEYFIRRSSYERAEVTANTPIIGVYYEQEGSGYVITTDETFKSSKNYYQIKYTYNPGSKTVGQSLTDETDIYYEYVTEGYWLSEDTTFKFGKSYYLNVKKEILPDVETLYVDPYLDYTEVIPTEFIAVLGSGAVVTSEDVDAEGNVKGLAWYVVQEGVSEEYPLIRSGKFLANIADYNRRYDENGRFIFAWNAGNLGLKCYIVGSEDISNEATLALSVYTRSVFQKTNDFGKTVNYIDVYNNGSTISENVGLYTETSEKSYIDINCYEKASSDLLARLDAMLAAQKAGQPVYVGIRFSSVGMLYSLPITWEIDTIERIENVLKGISSLTPVETANGGIFLKGVICQGKVNEQTLYIPFSVKVMELVSIEVGNSKNALEQRVYSIVNDEDKDNRLTMSELQKSNDTGYAFTDQYLRYIDSSDMTDAYSPNVYGNVLYLELDKAFGLSNNKEGYFCTPYDYLVYLFNNTTLHFSGGVDLQAIAGGQIKFFTTRSVDMTKADAQEKLKNYFNRSVFCLEDNTVVEDEGIVYSYSFIELYKFSEGSAISRSIIIIRALSSEFTALESSLTLEPFNKDLTMAYGVNGYGLPKYEDVTYTNAVGATYNVRYETAKWTPFGGSQETTTALGEQPISAIPNTRINIISGAQYSFTYTLPVTEETFHLRVTVPRKDIAKVKYSAEQDIYVIENGVLMVDNPFLFFYYDNLTQQYKLNESRIPTSITSIVTTTAEKENGAKEVYDSTTINSYDIKWKFVYNSTSGDGRRLDSSVFSQGGKFLIATYSYDAYYVPNESGKGYDLYSTTIELYVNVAKLSYYGVKMNKEDDGVDVKESVEGVGAVGTMNNIEIDPYGSSFNGSYTLPVTMTFYFNSLLEKEVNGEVQQIGKVVEYTFSNLVFKYDGNVYGKSMENYSPVGNVIPYNESGHLISKEQYPPLGTYKNSVFLKVFIYYEQGVNLRDDITLSVTILSRSIDKVRLYNTVYDNGEDINFTTETYGFIPAAITVGSVVSANTYYVTENGRFVLTTDSKFLSGKEYYVRTTDTTNLACEYRESEYYERAEDISDTTKTYYQATKAITTAGEAVSATYYRKYSVMYRPTESTYQFGTVYYRKTTPGSAGYKYEYSYTYGYYIESPDPGAEVFTVIDSEETPVNTAVAEGVYCRKDVYFPVYSVTKGYKKTTDRSIVPGKTYYELSSSGLAFGDKEFIGTSTEYYTLVGQDYIRQVGQFKSELRYGTFRPASIPTGETRDPSQYNYYEEFYVYATFETGVEYYVAERATGVNGLGITSYLYFENDKNLGIEYLQTPKEGSYSSNQKYYVAHRVPVVAGYRLAQDYYVYTAGRYEKTKDEVFDKTTAYYIFTKVAAVDNKGVYYTFFSGFENTSFYALARKEVEEENGEITSSDVPVYYVDPYNVSTFSLPTQVSIKFKNTDDFKFYDISGWQVYNNDGTATDFVRYTEDPTMVNSAYGISLYDASSTARFYEVPATKSNNYYGFFMVGENDYNGGTYRIRGYLTVGTSRQPFDVLVVVLNRAMRIGEELNREYDLTYDYDDPVSALLTDIPSAIGSGMFVSYDSYYLNFNLDGARYVIEDKYSYSYNNGNAPVIPTVLWKEDWTYNGVEYNFNTVSISGYDGDIYGNVYAKDYNIDNLQNKYFSNVYESYMLLAMSWMWDVFTSGDYSGKAKEAIKSANEELEKDVIVNTYYILSNYYSKTVTDEGDSVLQQYYTYITQNYYNELMLEMQLKNGKVYDATNDAREIILYMFDKLKASHEEWQASVGLAASKAGRPQIYEDWLATITDYAVDLYTPETANDEITSSINDYQKLKAYYYGIVNDPSKNNFTSASEKRYNESVMDRYIRQISDCIGRDIWTDMQEYANIIERRKMRAISSQNYADTDTYIKARSLEMLTSDDEIDGVSGEEAKAHISIPVLEYSKLHSYSILDRKPDDWESSFFDYYYLDGDKYVQVPQNKDIQGQNIVPEWRNSYYYSHSDTVVYFSPFDFTSINDEFIVEFRLSYDDIYQNRLNDAKEDVVSQYRDEYASASLKELENVLIEIGVNTISQTETMSNGQVMVVLQFTPSGDYQAATPPPSIEFTYQNYMDALRNLVKIIKATDYDKAKLWSMDELYDYLVPYGSLDNDSLRYTREAKLDSSNMNNYYVLNAELWERIRQYYLDKAMETINTLSFTLEPLAVSISDEDWARVRDTYYGIYSNYISEGKEDYAEFSYEVYGLFRDTYGQGENYKNNLVMIINYVKANYPMLKEMDEILYDEDRADEAYRIIADLLLQPGSGSGDNLDLPKSIQNAISSDSTTAVATILRRMYESLNGTPVLDLLNRWESRHNQLELNANESSATTKGTYSYGYTNVFNQSGDEIIKLWKSLFTETDGYENFRSIANIMFDFLVEYVANVEFEMVEVTSGASIAQPNNKYYVRKETGTDTGKYYYSLETNTTFKDGIRYYIKKAGTTSFDGLYNNIKDYGYTTEDVDKGLEWIKESDTYKECAKSLKALYSYLMGDIDAGFTALTIKGFYQKEGDNEPLDASLAEPLAKVMFYRNFIQTMTDQNSVYKLQQEVVESTEKIKARAVKNLIEYYEEMASRNDTIGTRVTGIFQTFFIDPSKYNYGNKINPAKCSLASRAFIYLLENARQQTAGAYLNDYATREEEFAIENMPSRSKDILDTMLEGCTSAIGSTGGYDYAANYNQTNYLFSRFYRLAITSGTRSGDFGWEAVPAYELKKFIGTELYYPAYLTLAPYQSSVGDLLDVATYLEGEASKLFSKYNKDAPFKDAGGFSNEVRTAIVNKYLKNYCLRTILYYYDSLDVISTQRNIVDEVAVKYIGGQCTELNLLKAAYAKNDASSAEELAKDFFKALLSRHDLGDGFREKLYQAYYTFFLSETERMLAYGVENSAMPAVSTATVEAAMRSILGLSSLTSEQITRVGKIVERQYRDTLKNNLINRFEKEIGYLTSQAYEELKSEFAQVAYEIYYSDEYYKDELDSILDFIVQPGKETAYRKAFGNVSENTYLEGKTYYTYEKVTVTSGERINLMTQAYYVKDGDIYRLTHDEKFKVGTEYYIMKPTDVIVGNPIRNTDVTYVPFTYYIDEVRYVRVEDILISTGRTYPELENYYADVYNTMQDNIVKENLEQFYAALEKGVEKSIYEDLYDSMHILTLSSEDFAKVFARSRGVTTDVLGTAENTFLTDEAIRTLKNNLSVSWWNETAFVSAYRNYFGEDIVISGLESELIEAIYSQQTYAYDESTAKGMVPQIIYRFLQRMEEYRDGKGDYADRQPVDRGILTKNNILKNDYREVTIDYKSYYVSVMLFDDDFMSGYKKGGKVVNSVSFMQSTFRTLYKEFLTSVANNFATATETTYTNGDAVSYIVECLSEKTFSRDQTAYEAEYAIYMRYMSNVMEVMSHTSAYANMALGEDYPLKEYFDRTYELIAGVRKGTTASYTEVSNEDPTVLGKLTLAHYIRIQTEASYGKAINALSDDRIVTIRFYSADHLTVDSEEEKLCHVIYFDAGRSTEWAEFQSTGEGHTANDSQSGTVYFANSRKTTEYIKAHGESYSEYIEKYVYDHTPYYVVLDENATQTTVTFINNFDPTNTDPNKEYSYSYHTDGLTFSLRDLSLIHVLFEDASGGEMDTLEIDVLNPVFPKRIHAYGFVGDKQVADLGYITDFAYSEQFSALSFIVDESTANVNEKYSRITEGDDAYYISVPQDSGKEPLKVRITVKYRNRSIDKMYSPVMDYSINGTLATDVEGLDGYYDLYTTEHGKFNVINIVPNNSAFTKADHTGYILPSELYVKYGDGTGEFYTDIKWDESNITYTLDGTRGEYVETRILSYRLQSDDGYYIVSFNYSASTITLSHYDSSNTLYSGGTVVFDIQKDDSGNAPDIDWNTRIHIEQMPVKTVTFTSGDNTYACNISSGVIDCTENGYFVNQFYPEYPETLTLTFLNGTTEEITLKQSDWQVENESQLRAIINRSETAIDDTFVVRFNYMGYSVRVKFQAYDIDLTNATGTYMKGGTLYLVQKQDSASNQIEKNYSLVYFNFGSADKPNWKKVPVYIAHSNVSADTLRKYDRVYGAIGASEADIIANNVEFTIIVVTPKLFAELEGELNRYIEYNYFAYAHDSNNRVATSQINTPDSLGDKFIYDFYDDYGNIEQTVEFRIDGDIEYDFMNGIAIISVLYNMVSETDSRIALDEKGTSMYRMEVRVPLYGYLNSEIEQYTKNNTENVLFDRNKEYESDSWTWSETEDDAIYWQLGKTMKASDLPTGITVDTNKSFSFYWDLSDVNVNLATDEGYIVRAYYYTATRWESKMLKIYINKVDLTEKIKDFIASEYRDNNDIKIDETIISKTYDAKFFELQFDPDQVADDSDKIYLIRKDGTKGILENSENLIIEYRSITGDEDSWSAEYSPINAGTYYIRIILDDYNYYLSSTDRNGAQQMYVVFTLTISPKRINISKMGYVGQQINASTQTPTYDSYMSKVYDGKPQEVHIVTWYLTENERSILLGAALSDYPNADNEAKASVFDRLYARSSAEEQAYLDYLIEVALEGDYLKSTSGWSGYDDDWKRIIAKVYLFDNLLTQDELSALPYVTVDKWFAAGEKDTLYRRYMEGRGDGSYSGVLCSETEAKSIAYSIMYNRVNDAARNQIRKWYEQAKKHLGTATEMEINAYVYDTYFPAGEFVICEVELHIVYTGESASTSAPTDVRSGGYRVEVSIVPTIGNYGNYISTGTDTYDAEEGVSSTDPRFGVGYVSFTLDIIRDETVTYTIAGNTLTYNGKVQNPGVSPVVDAEGNVAPGVTIQYEYTLTDGTLVVERTTDGARIIRGETSSPTSYAGIRNVGTYNVTISVDGGNNFISTTGATLIRTTINIIPMDIFIELDDIETYYQEGMAEYTDYIRIHNGSSEGTCNKCGAELRWYPSDDNKVGTYYLYCPNCNVKMEAEFSHMTTACYCTDCVRNRLAGKPDVATIELYSDEYGIRTYRFYCPTSKTEYYIYHNVDQLMGSETLSNLGNLIINSSVEEYYPLGTYPVNIGGLIVEGGMGAYTTFGAENSYAYYHSDADRRSRIEEYNFQRYGSFIKLELLAQNQSNSLYNDRETFGNIIQIFENYNVFIKASSEYVITTREGAIGVSGEEELAAELNKLSDGDTAVLYISAKRGSDNSIEAYNPIVIDKDIDLTLVGYYNVGKEMETILSGITLKKGTLTLRIIEVRLTRSGAGLSIQEQAGVVKIDECLFTVGGTGNYTDTVGIRTNIKYKEKLSVSKGSRFEGLTTGIMLDGGDMEVKDSYFNDNGKGIHIASSGSDLSVRKSVFTNHRNYAVLSDNKNATVLEDTFYYNSVAISIPEILNADMYKNTFKDEEGNYTNTVDIIADDGRFVSGTWIETGR